MHPILITILAIIPGLSICYLIYRFDKYEKEAIIPLVICFGLGVISAFPALKLEEFGDRMGVIEGQSFWMLLLLSYIVIALSEELMKFLALFFYPFQKSFFNEPIDGIVYSVMIGMGFATIENIFYAHQFGTQTTIVRAFTAVPAHAVFGILMGYFIGLAKFNRKKKWQFLGIGLGMAVLVHGTYDLFILQHYYDWLIVFATFTLLLSGYFAYRLIKVHQDASPFKNKNPETNINRIEPDQMKGEIKESNDIQDAVFQDLNDDE